MTPMALPSCVYHSSDGTLIVSDKSAKEGCQVAVYMVDYNSTEHSQSIKLRVGPVKKQVSVEKFHDGVWIIFDIYNPSHSDLVFTIKNHSKPNWVLSAMMIKHIHMPLWHRISHTTIPLIITFLCICKKFNYCSDVAMEILNYAVTDTVIKISQDRETQNRWVNKYGGSYEVVFGEHNKIYAHGNKISHIFGVIDIVTNNEELPLPYDWTVRDGDHVSSHTF